MKKRHITIILAIIIIIASIALSKLLSNQKEAPKRILITQSVKQVKTFVVKNKDVANSIFVTGKLIATDKIEVFAEVGGMLLKSPKEFKEGNHFNRGETLLNIDDTEARINLLAKKSVFLNILTQLIPDIRMDYSESSGNWEKYLKDYDLKKNLEELPDPASDKEKYFLASKNIYTQFYNIKSMEVRIGKYTIRAPFNGAVSESNINTGTIVRVGQKLGEFIRSDSYELEAAVSISEIEFIEVGDSVLLTSNDIADKWEGFIKRISKKIDPNTQTLKLFISVQGNKLKEGMYIKGEIYSMIIENAVEIPRRLLINKNSVFVIQDSLLQLQNVEVLKFTEETVVIRGLNDGMIVPVDNITGAYQGMTVRTDN